MSGSKARSIDILNVRLDDYTLPELLSELKRGVLVTPNVDHIVKVQTDREFYQAAGAAEYSICDSRILQLMSRIKGEPLREAIPGSSFFPAYCDYHAGDEAVKIFLLGAREGVADTARQKINARIGREIIVGAYSPPFGFDRDEAECQHIVNILNASGANVVLVGVGNPKQTTWIQRYKAQVPGVDLWMALGATIDFEAGNIKRAPALWQRLRMEWLYRFLCEPRRLFRRYFVDDMKFFYHFAKQLLGVYKNPFG